ncbi:hypothetical protein H9Q72_003896 [Fusarium xylarioides]|uniref:Uncharacterized protein n=1 Tax=Fusarium xylarioides TaxID=221167 RepID=A0A9P7J158_9HYPO|nr:hypothetical protein H9Q70_003756 [Fusarium xylarioides]KAG5768662.1 hypothetical protein H9Q72_003896 [Fusarium xylarioides]KAG5780579.1 hypothetical protein H9Q73_005744 [Fusarium xylarioides]KAG5817678.1 hypothetical protein H9Q71_001782 [Fusarium xylarioides]KAG5827812.1 hypothetical protein H9Q74_002088 [Fusarium xylarioides]
MFSVLPNTEQVILATMDSYINKLIGPKIVSFFPERALGCEDDYRRIEALIYIASHMPRPGPYQVFERLHRTRFQDRNHRSRRMSVTKDTFLTHNMTFPKAVPSQLGSPPGYNLISLGLRLVASTFDHGEVIPHIRLTEYAMQPLSLTTFPQLEEFTMMCLRPTSHSYQSLSPFLNSSTDRRGEYYGFRYHQDTRRVEYTRLIWSDVAELAFAGEDLKNGLFPYTIVRLWIVGQRRGRYRMPKELEWTHLDLYSEFREHHLNRIRDLWMLTRMRLENPIRDETCQMVV